MVEVEDRKKVLSRMYKILLSTSTVVDKAKDGWERDLEMECSDNQWQKIKEFNHTFSVNVPIRENRFKSNVSNYPMMVNSITRLSKLKVEVSLSSLLIISALEQ